MLDHRQLEVLRAVAREGSLSAAGRTLHYSQPTVAHHLSALERRFKVPLVERGPRGSRLTEAGAVLLAHAEAILDRSSLAERELDELVEHGTSTLRIGTFPTAGALLLPPAVRAILRDGVQVAVVEAELPLLVEELGARRLDLALVFSQPGDNTELSEAFTVQPLLEDPLLLILPEDHPLSGRRRIAIEDLRTEKWVVGTTESDPCDRVLRRACANAGYEPQLAFRTDDYGVAQGFVAAGIGIGLVPRLALEPPRPDVAVRTIADQHLARQVSVVTLAGAVPPGAAQLVDALGVQARRIRSAWGRRPATPG